MQEYERSLEAAIAKDPPNLRTQVSWGRGRELVGCRTAQSAEPKVDLPGQSGEAGLGHLGTTERQCTAMPLRMAEYCLGMLRWFGKFPRQIVLYWGRSAPLRMESVLRGPDVWFRYRAIDIRDLDGERLLEKG